MKDHKLKGHGITAFESDAVKKHEQLKKTELCLKKEAELEESN